MKFDDAFTFGKYKGSTPRELLRNNKGLYLMWCLENVKCFKIEPFSIEQAIRERYSRQYIAAFKK